MKEKTSKKTNKFSKVVDIMNLLTKRGLLVELVKDQCYEDAKTVTLKVNGVNLYFNVSEAKRSISKTKGELACYIEAFCGRLTNTEKLKEILKLL